VFILPAACDEDNVMMVVMVLMITMMDTLEKIIENVHVFCPRLIK
jgi:hypothetical protein